MLGTSSESNQMAALLQSTGTLLMPKTEPANTVALRASIPEGLKVKTLLYWQSSANLSPNFCTSPSNFCTWDPYTMRPSKSACDIARLPREGKVWVSQLALSKEGC